MLDAIDEALESYDGVYQYVATQSVLSQYLCNLLSQKNLSEEDIKILFSKEFELERVGIDGDPLDVISDLINGMRESSHGASVAKKVFIGSQVLPLEDNKEYKIRGVELIQSEHLPANCIVVLGESKFRLVSPDKLIVLCELNLEKNG